MPNTTSLSSWADLMGRDLPRADVQPLQAAHVTRSGTLPIVWRTFSAAGFQAGERVGVALRDGRAVLDRQDDGLPLEKGKDASLPVSDEVASALGAGDARGAIVVGGHGAVRILPVRVHEHAPDVLGPRFVDHVRDDCIVRHAVPGPPHGGWTDDALAELEGLVCGEPFRIDPVAILAEGDDWAAWMTRNRVLALPAPDDQTLHQRLVGDVLQGQQHDGSWGAVPATAYAVLRLLALGAPPSDDRVQRAARWLLDLPEPPPRPGMWMLTDQYRDEWLARREPKNAALGACQIIHTPPDDAINFFSWRFPDAEQDQFRAQECQRVVPTCARHHPPACEPRITHVSALVAEALLRCGFADHPRLRRYVHTAFHVGGEWGYWCGCGALGLYDPDIPADDGLWHHETLFRTDWGKPATPPEPRLATWHVVAALSKFGLLDRLRP